MLKHNNIITLFSVKALLYGYNYLVDKFIQNYRY